LEKNNILEVVITKSGPEWNLELTLSQTAGAFGWLQIGLYLN